MFWRQRWFERYAPIGLGVITLGLLAYFRQPIASQFSPTGLGHWQVSNLYNAVFNWASIQSGFVFGIYGFIATKRDGFAGEIARSEFYALLSYARWAYMTGFALTFISLPLMVAAPTVTDPSKASYWIVAVWFSWFIWTFCAFLRVAFIFGIVVATPDKPARIAG